VPVDQTAPGRFGVSLMVMRVAAPAVADDAVLEEPQRAGRMRALGEGEGDEREPHAHEHDLAVADLAAGRDDHQLALGEAGGMGRMGRLMRRGRRAEPAPASSPGWPRAVPRPGGSEAVPVGHAEHPALEPGAGPSTVRVSS
jgi:hypothetical protein